MKYPFVLNTEAPRSELVCELQGQLDELEGSLFAMGVAVHGGGIPVSTVMATQRQIRNIRQLAEAVV